MVLRFVVLDELHTYRGRQGADVALLMRRVRNRLEDKGAADSVHWHIGRHWRVEGTFEEQQRQVAQVASDIFGVKVQPDHIIGETLLRSTPRELDDATLSPVVAKGNKIPTPAEYEDFRGAPAVDLDREHVWFARGR